VTIVIPRSVWKPRYANGFAVIGTSEWLAVGKEIWLHHSVTNPFGPGATLEQDCQHMRDFEQIGQNRFGGGISYTWVVMPSGRVFEGHSPDRQGSHTYQRNNRSRAICLAGNYDVNALPGNMERSVAVLLRELDATIDGPHSQVYPTACPGRYATPRIGPMNQLALSGAPITEDDDFMTDVREQIITVDGISYSLAQVLHLLVSYIHAKAPKVARDAGGNPVLGDIFGADIFTDNPGTPEETPVRVRDLFTELRAKAVADVDEAALAVELERLGAVGLNVADVKLALQAAMREGTDPR
jgi:hypothetical protein